MTNEAVLGEWSSLLDALLRGLAHALSNRTGALAALAELGAGENAREAREMIPGELARLHELNRLVRLLPAEPRSSPEALAIGDVVADAVALIALHPRARELRWTLRTVGDPPPVRTERWVLLRTVLLLLDAALRDALEHAATEVVVAATGDERTSTLYFWSDGASESRPADTDSAPSWPPSDSAPLVARLGGSLFRAGSRIELRLPSLAALRRRDRTTGVAGA